MCVCVCVCVGLFCCGGAVFFLSSCSAQGRLLLSLLLEFTSVSLPAVFRGVFCRRFPLGGCADFLAPVACPAPAVELCLLGLRCLSCEAWGFCPCAVLCLRHLRFCAAGPAAAYSSGFLPFSVPVCLPTAALMALVGLPPLPCVLGAVHRLSCWGSVGSAPCDRELPWWL